MPARPTDEQLAAWRALADAATEGPWSIVEEPGEWNGDPPDEHPMAVEAADREVASNHKYYPRGVRHVDMRFIAAARAAVPALLDEVARLREVVDALPKCGAQLLHGDSFWRRESGCGKRLATMSTMGMEYWIEFACDSCAAESEPLNDWHELPYAAQVRALTPPTPPGFDANGSPVE